MNKKQRVLFCSGFPRAGSTLLMNILSQNDKLFPTPTSGLIGSVTTIRDNWIGNDIYKSNGEDYIYPKIKTMLKNMIIGFYEKEVLEGKIPIDKNRSWVQLIDLLDEIFDCEVKIIYPIRYLGDICISMERVNRKSTVNFHGDNGDILNEKTTIGRINNFIKDDGVLGQCIVQLREFYYRKLENRLIFVPYNDLLTYPEDTLNILYDSLGMERYKHDFNNIKQTLQEDDIMHGFAPNSLHKIKEGNILPIKKRDYNIINKNIIKEIEDDKYKDITDMINNLSKIKRYE